MMKLGSEHNDCTKTLNCPPNAGVPRENPWLEMRGDDPRAGSDCAELGYLPVVTLFRT